MMGFALPSLFPNIGPKNRPSQKEMKVFQPSIFHDLWGSSTASRLLKLDSMDFPWKPCRASLISASRSWCLRVSFLCVFFYVYISICIDICTYVCTNAHNNDENKKETNIIIYIYIYVISIINAKYKYIYIYIYANHLDTIY